MSNVYTPGKLKPLRVGDKVADFPDVDGEITLSQLMAAIKAGLILLPDETSGELPDPSLVANQGRVAVSGNHFVQSRDFGDHIKMVGLKDYGPARVVDTGEPVISALEMTYVGSYENIPPGSSYALHVIAWDRGSGVWIRNNTANGSSWSNLPSHLIPAAGIWLRISQ